MTYQASVPAQRCLTSGRQRCSTRPTPSLLQRRSSGLSRSSHLWSNTWTLQAAATRALTPLNDSQKSMTQSSRVWKRSTRRVTQFHVICTPPTQPQPTQCVSTWCHQERLHVGFRCDLGRGHTMVTELHGLRNVCLV